MKLRLGTRASALAAWQARWVADRLARQGIDVELVPITTAGDRQRTEPIGQIGTQGVFTKEIQNELLAGRVDLAVHSLKDLATVAVPGLALVAVPERGPVADVLVFRDTVVTTLNDLPPRAVVATGSPRRKAQLLHARPDLRIKDLRGNVETRLAKLDAGRFDAVVLAEAGLRRLGLEARIGQVLPPAIMLPAVGQGALAVEMRADDPRARAVARAIDHASTHAAVAAERAMLAALQGGCLAPVAAWARVEGETLRLDGRVMRLDGSERLDAASTGPIAEPESLGRRVAAELIEQGAAEFIREARAE
ncbi:MAG TPA: hydroxymethylbilane synthase [Thermoguttaceae bacterium]|nr:hydroxymethylbilane synthase [Thermoguttaceae bacterium]